MDEEAKLAPLLAVRLLFRSKGQFVDLPHVTEAVSLFLDSSVELPLHKACKRDSIPLLDRLWASSQVFVNNIAAEDDAEDETYEQGKGNFTLRKFLRTDRHYKQFQFTKSLFVAIDDKNLEMVKWLLDKFQGCVVRQEVVSEACIIGSVEMLRLFHDNDNSSLDENVRVEGVGVRVDWGPT
ncbi:hypothetical protein PHYSODRAFT_264078 [Phytophthora sojae]|uniref:Uncharacterized protein n=1 Tax=Phytophthora sojae (strain P6497) TaxID=1094619 RepID=G4ZLM3_PHYSP|nr:hypothetical protein PHYSODRAFT_264078 [Phytophthora sojae]EGZ14598.1 hypothetical protein PHYSODRAFT_264078 [Phytophthora sojae]|eukprot:XP_009528347.1 hypothetical protein PHYSODRAFT_264078 [Phytophthora sojae]